MKGYFLKNCGALSGGGQPRVNHENLVPNILSDEELSDARNLGMERFSLR